MRIVNDLDFVSSKVNSCQDFMSSKLNNGYQFVRRVPNLFGGLYETG